MEELGLPKSIPIPVAGNLEYVLEEVWTDGDLTSTRFSALPDPLPLTQKRVYKDARDYEDT